MKTSFNRRQFLGTLGPLIMIGCTNTRNTSAPEMILHNANIITSNPSLPYAQALAHYQWQSSSGW